MGDRCDGRSADELRTVKFELDYQVHPAGSVVVSFGRTRVLCSVSVTEGVPRWMREQGVEGGWLTAEYRMLPGATDHRSQRASSSSGPSGRSLEIQRLIGRSLRAAVDLKRIPGKTLYVDCDVIDADGGTRCASITGAALALELALQRMFVDGRTSEWPLQDRVAAISVGMVDGRPLLDLCYREDSSADVDMNVVMLSNGRFVEVQGAAEDQPFSQEEMDDMLSLAKQGIEQVFALQRETMKASVRA
ncbi:MAG: ribonuclease PH [Lentisphaerae bacterium]|jgi:ribonuclease PH|nr:ribonuclease PH [Lentisphaerota bacterium]MBT4816077.1 ribonuclease PH [Lentisphaerota bacterium]MBT5613162.1 ribonuclease PH [Lentisphaerota bacterium]MBT7061946.1 ribonuclease PH [Lentisphaerota bacterium]MBT7844546.1 ribonuclease PH [Lentisphaerota bacterium]